ncbi:excinuclease ABC subunit A [Salipiger sp. P9]|uniref:excinuclease ABC subunit A n=1 Tax=Salipiger pentaromativorans TaxID=2943193 RepID=UPI0021582DAA|nr:excinuclease ABC subunit A [Salipiger pentaromativorans]MCR8547253.1 excinuclease ABC subunit A [Salipiger pentaromativorans]
MRQRLAIALIATATALSLPLAASAAPKGCPPGLAKKHSGCTPPGLAKKVQRDRPSDSYAYRERERDRYRIGERISDGYIVLRDPRAYGLLPDHTYYRSNDVVYRVDPQTREVLDVIGAVAALLD